MHLVALDIGDILVDRDDILVPIYFTVLDEHICQRMVDIDGDDYMTNAFVAEAVFNYDDMKCLEVIFYYSSVAQGPIPIPINEYEEEFIIRTAYKSEEVMYFLQDLDEKRGDRWYDDEQSDNDDDIQW